MRVGLNLLHALPEVGGVWNYISNILAALADSRSDNTYIGFVTQASECLLPAQSNFKKIVTSLRSHSRPRRVLYENSMLQLLAFNANLDCMHWFAGVQGVFNAVPSVVTIHDLQPFTNPADFAWTKRLYLKTMMGMTSKRAGMLLPISESTGAAMRAQFGADDSRMSVIPCPLHKRFTRSSAAEIENFRARYQLPLNFWLYVAHMYPHKNHLRLLMAYQKLKADGQMPWKLVLRGNDKGSHREISEAIAQHGLKQDVLFLPELPDDELPRLYSAASALVFPSLHEGLGIPLLEAMACGCPITASEIPAVRETTQDAAVYFDPLNIDNVAETMRQVQSRDDLRARSHKLGLDRAEAFRAPKIVSKLLAAYSCVSRKSPT